MDIRVDPNREYTDVEISVIIGRSVATARRLLKTGALRGRYGADIILYLAERDAPKLQGVTKLDTTKRVYHVWLTIEEAAALDDAGYEVVNPRERRRVAQARRRAEALAELKGG